jgi:uncharacterized Fe-S cluster protein YjdI
MQEGVARTYRTDRIEVTWAPRRCTHAAECFRNAPEVFDPYASDDVVVVTNRDHTHVFYMGLTQRIERPASFPRDRLVAFGESARGIAAPITAWYPLGESRGYEFLYARR